MLPSALKSSLPAHNFQRIQFNYLITSIILVHVTVQSPKVKHAKNRKRKKWKTLCKPDLNFPNR